MSGATHYCLRCYKEMEIAVAGEDGGAEGKNEAPTAEASCVHCGNAFDPQDEKTFVSFDVLSPWAAYLLAFLVLLFGAGFILGLAEDNPMSNFSGTEFEAAAAGDSFSDTRQHIGWALVFGLPICLGAVLGYTSSPRRFKIWQKFIFGILLFCGLMVTVGLISQLRLFGAPARGFGMGVFCMVMLGLVFILPFMLGDWLGYAIRRRDERKKRNWKWVKVVVFLLLPFGLDAVERLVPRGEDLAVVETQAVFEVPQERAWNSIVFYEQIEHEPPFLLRLALPRPVGTVGVKAAVGDTSRCEYENGYLVKKVTEREEGRVLGFRVIEQKLHFEHDLELRDGSFRLEPGPEPGTTLVTLETTYRRLTYPAFIWQPVETLVLHTLHGHVLEGMRANAEKEITVEPGAEIPGPVGLLEFPGRRESAR